MKTLYLVRHAKSSWEHDVNDHQRPLKKRGKKDAPMVAAKAAGQVAAPQKIISSDAVRAKTTAAYFKNAFGLPDNHFTLDHSLYDFSGQNVMQIIKNLDNALHTVMLVGHNHAFTSIANMLGSTYIENMPTSGFVMITFNEVKWGEISSGTTKKMIFPRHLK